MNILLYNFSSPFIIVTIKNPASLFQDFTSDYLYDCLLHDHFYYELRGFKTHLTIHLERLTSFPIFFPGSHKIDHLLISPFIGRVWANNRFPFIPGLFPGSWRPIKFCSFTRLGDTNREMCPQLKTCSFGPGCFKNAVC